MKTVWEFPLTYRFHDDKREAYVLKMPVGALVMHVHEQDGYACLWAIADPKAPKVERVFKLLATGESIPDQLAVNYLGTCHTRLSLVWHVFEIKE